MTEPLTTALLFATTRSGGCPFDLPADLTQIRQRNTLARMIFPDGHRGWLATGYDTVRTILADPRFSARSELMHSALADLGPLPPAAPGHFLNLDAPEHSRYRKLLTGKFTVRRMRLLAERMAQISTEYLDAMERAGGPADLVPSFAYPVPALMICELLGVPAADRERFEHRVTDLIATLNDPDAPLEQSITTLGETQQYMRQLVAAKRTKPTDDLLSDLTGTDLTEDELGAIGELMRYLTIAHTTTRSALADVELAGQIIKAGETVALSLRAADRDPIRFDHPDTLDLRRTAVGHLGFGHGIHLCLGQQLARLELRTAVPALLSRFPHLRLAVPQDQIRMRPTGIGVLGVQQLPVTW